jgi:hypothetical protein
MVLQFGNTRGCAQETTTALAGPNPGAIDGVQRDAGHKRKRAAE